jgi:hypothetical protein
MKPNTTYVDACHFETAIQESGLQMIAQKGFIKVMGATGRQVYVAATKRVGRVDISGFTVDLPGVRTLGDGEAFGNVKQQMDFSRTQDEILATFRDLLAHLASLPAAEKQERKAPAKKADEPKGWSAATLESRKALIEKVAKEKGVKVSPKARIAADAQ